MKTWLSNLFLSAPQSIKNVLVSLKGFQNNIIRKGSFYKKYLNLYLKSHKWTQQELESYQLQTLQKLLQEIYDYSPYYRQLFDDLSIQREQIITDPLKVLSILPLLKKETLKHSLDDVINANPDRKNDVKNFTSGTSGSPMTTYFDKESAQILYAIWKRFHYSMHLPHSFKSIRLSGRIINKAGQDKPPFWVYNATNKQLLFSTYHLNEKNIPHYIDKINSFQPLFLDGYPSALYILAKYINTHQITLKIRPLAIATTAETLYDHYKVEIESAFQCKVYNQYASSEGGAFITECNQGHLHLNLETGIFEFIDKNGTFVHSGGLAELVITSFRSWKTPLIRYRTGDWVELYDHPISCDCGYQTPIVKKIIGREDDILYTKEAGYVGRMDTAFKGLSGINKSQIHQVSIDVIIIYLEINDQYNKNEEEQFLINLRARLGSTIQIKLKKVTDIPLGKNGKFNAVIRDFPLP